jgi:dipeptidyl aminopeptidase/acylaminoacyl peptidase
MLKLKSFLGAFLLATAGANAQELPPAEAFARLPAAQFVTLSPNGEQLAYVAHTGDNKLAVVRDLATGEERGLGVTGYRMQGIRWANDDTFILTVDEAIRPLFTRGDIDVGTLYTVDVDTMRGRVLLDRPSIASGSRRIALFPSSASFVGFERDTGDLLMSMQSEGGQYSLFRVDPQSGAVSRRTRGSGESAYWVADQDGSTYAEFTYSRDDQAYSVRVHEDGRSRDLATRSGNIIQLSVQGFAPDGEALILSRSSGQPPYTRLVQEMSLETGELGDVLFQDPENDFQSILRDPHNGEIVGLIIERDYPETVWFDEELAQVEDALEGAFGEDARIMLGSWSANRQRFIVNAYPPDQGVIYYLFDRAAGTAEPVRAAYPELLSTTLPARSAITFEARDGTQIPAYVTRPASNGPVPFVVLVHGGPASRDTGGFDYFAHFLASRGYGVIQPNFRGSDGYGAVWETAGWGEWGTGVMQTDVLDAAAAMRDQGLASSVCIAGASYGGYAALAGATLTPDAFDCAISINGLTSMARHVQYVDDRIGSDSLASTYWRRSMTGSSEGENLAALDAQLSPLQQAEAARIPILLIHGNDDTVVEFRQSRMMSEALGRTGAPVRFVELDGGDHWLLEFQTRLTVLNEMEAFLAEHAQP